MNFVGLESFSIHNSQKKSDTIKEFHSVLFAFFLCAFTKFITEANENEIKIKQS